MKFKKRQTAIFSLLLTLNMLIFTQAGISAENPSLRDIAIADLANISGNSDLDGYGKSIAETIFTELAFSQKLSLVERGRLKDAVIEISRGELGVTDPSTAAEIGRAVGARHIFVGTLSEFQGEGVIIVNARLIDVESSKVISGWNERTTINRLSQVPFDLAKKILGQLFPRSPFVAALKSTIIPSWGQFSNGRTPSGILTVIGGLASIGGVVATQTSLSSAEKDLDELRKLATGGNLLISREENERLADEFDKAAQDVDDKRKNRNTAAIVLGAVWGLNILDAFVETHLLRKSREQAVQRTLAFEATPDLRGIVMRVRF